MTVATRAPIGDGSGGDDNVGCDEKGRGEVGEEYRGSESGESLCDGNDGDKSKVLTTRELMKRTVVTTANTD